MKSRALNPLIIAAFLFALVCSAGDTREARTHSAEELRSVSLMSLLGTVALSDALAGAGPYILFSPFAALGTSLTGPDVLLSDVAGPGELTSGNRITIDSSDSPILVNGFALSEPAPAKQPPPLIESETTTTTPTTPERSPRSCSSTQS